MNYNDIRPFIRSGDILAWSHHGIKSWYAFKIWLVRLFLRSEYSHIGTAWVIGERVFVIEAVTPLVRIYPLSKCGDFYHLNMNAPWFLETEAFALSKVGHKYSQVQAIQSVLKDIPDDDLWECAELAGYIARSDGINLGKRYTPSAIVLEAQRQGAVLNFVHNTP